MTESGKERHTSQIPVTSRVQYGKSISNIERIRWCGGAVVVVVIETNSVAGEKPEFQSWLRRVRWWFCLIFRVHYEVCDEVRCEVRSQFVTLFVRKFVRRSVTRFVARSDTLFVTRFVTSSKVLGSLRRAWWPFLD